MVLILAACFVVEKDGNSWSYCGPCESWNHIEREQFKRNWRWSYIAKSGALSLDLTKHAKRSLIIYFKEGLQVLIWKSLYFIFCCLQAVLVASRKSLTQRKGVLDITHEILERLEAHLRAIGQFTVCIIYFLCYGCSCL